MTNAFHDNIGLPPLALQLLTLLDGTRDLAVLRGEFRTWRGVGPSMSRPIDAPVSLQERLPWAKR